MITKEMADHTAIPLIDLGPLAGGVAGDDGHSRTGKDIYEAFKNVGFAYIKNHGIPQDLVDEAFAWVGTSACLSCFSSNIRAD